MLKFALLDYVPQRYLRRASFETIETDRMLLNFKSGDKFATRWAANLVGKALSSMDLSDTTIVCIPASCKRTNDRRFKAFSADVCAMCGAINGFSKIQVVGKRSKVHRSRHHEHTAEDNVMIDAAWFQGRRVRRFHQEDAGRRGRRATRLVPSTMLSTSRTPPFLAMT